MDEKIRGKPLSVAPDLLIERVVYAIDQREIDVQRRGSMPVEKRVD
jgi:hypothetical protein